MVLSTLLKWNISDRVAAMGFDTTASNTGEKPGACVYSQNNLDRKLLNFACRHHIYELLLRSAFESKFGKSSGPDIPIFERFAKKWKNLNKRLFKNGLEDPIVRSKISDEECDATKNFCRQKLLENHIRADYKELLELTLMFLGGDSVNFRTPGPTSHARWMAKAIYTLKVFLFRDQFALTPKELNNLRDICIFLVRMYVKAWIGCTDAIAAPNQDCNFIKESVAYAEIDSKMSSDLLLKIKNHFWYLSEENVALAFFDSNVSPD